MQLPSSLQVEGTPLPSPGTKAFDEALDAPDTPPLAAADTTRRAAGKKGKGGAATTVEQKTAAAARSAAAVASFLDLFAKPKGIKLRMALKARMYMTAIYMHMHVHMHIACARCAHQALYHTRGAGLVRATCMTRVSYLSLIHISEPTRPY